MSGNEKLAIGDEVFSTVARPPYGMVISADYGRDGYASVLWADGNIGRLKEEWLHKTGKHYPLEKWLEELENGT